MKPLIIHGHFYQPPRENPWTGIIDQEPGAHPFHDWNERIHAECYQPNCAVHIVDKDSGTERDRRTQVDWGLADFRHRFKREPEAMWLPETACNDEVLGLLIDKELRFVILAPQQAERIRPC